MDFIQEKEKMQYEFLKKFPRRMKNVAYMLSLYRTAVRSYHGNSMDSQSSMNR